MINCIKSAITDNGFTLLYILLTLLCILLAIRCFITQKALNKTNTQIMNRDIKDIETGMGNLLHFKNKFSSIITEFSSKNYYVVYIIIDSNFIQLHCKNADFSYILHKAASIFSKNINYNEFAARITETGFAISFSEVNKEHAKKRIIELVNELNSCVSCNCDDKFVFYTAVYNLQKNDFDIEFLLYNLRRACSSIIGTKNQILFCTSDSIHKAEKEQQTIEAIENGFKNDEFKLFLQFIVDNKTKKIVSAEALSRWLHPEQGIMPPGKFITSMEENGIISRLDYYMFDKVCKLLETWKNTEFSHITVSCNFTRITLSENGFMDKITAIADRYLFDKSKLIVEITEDAVEKNMETAVQNVKHLKDMGFRIALDDLGSGYTSLANLCEYPIDTVKIDRNILLKSNTENGSRLFKGMVALARRLNLNVICEGVETEEQYEFVSSTECNFVQGWYFSKPKPVSKCEEFINNYNRKHEFLLGSCGTEEG